MDHTTDVATPTAAAATDLPANVGEQINTIHNMLKVILEKSGDMSAFETRLTQLEDKVGNTSAKGGNRRSMTKKFKIKRVLK